jgi:hypothetical protein
MSSLDLLSNELDEEQRLFVSSFVLDFNFPATSRRTGISVARCRKMHKLPVVEQSIDQIKSKIAEVCDITSAQVLNELKRIAFYDINDHIKNVNSSGVTFKELEELDGRAIAEVTESCTPDGITYTNIKSHNKLKALEILANWFKGLPEEKHIHFHLDDEDLKGKTAAQLGQEYSALLNG